MATLLSGLGGAAGFGEQSFKTTTLTGGNLDDGFKQVDITSVFGASGINLYGTNYTTMFIGTNGLITFGGGITSYTPGALTGLGRPSITPQWTDIDITKGGDIYWDLDPATGKVTITWSNVASYSSTGTDSFQVVLTNAGSGNFGIDFNYGAIGFTNGGSGVAVAGISNGTTTQTLLPGSGNAALLTGYPNVDFLTNDPAGVFSLGYVGGQPSFIDGTVDGTAGNNLIDSTFVDSNGDRIDNNDATGFGGTTGNDDYVRAGDGNDTVISGVGNDIVFGGNGADSVQAGTGNDILYGEAGNDTLDGGADNDTLIGGGGADSLIGGAGIDLADYTASTLGVTVNLGLGTGLLGDAAGDTLSGIENVTGSNTGADILTGDGNANVLTGLVGADSLSGGLGNDTLDGGADNDTLIGGGGADSLIGGAGIDLADYTASTLGVTVNLGLGTGLLGDAAGDTLSGIENVTGSNTGADILTGDGNANVLTGLVGADSLDGGLGNDTLDGGADNDTLIGGGGADSLIGGAGIDLADYTASTLGVTVNLGLGTGLVGDAAGDTLSGIENVTGSNTGADILTGDGNANVLTGLVGADSLDGGLGNDTLDGGADNDTLIGGGGADSLIGGAGIDLADYTASTLGVTVNLGLGTGLVGDAAGDTLSGIENVTGSNTGADILTGDGNANVLTGLVGADSLDGGLGNDTLDGGADNDTLIGGGGADSLIGGAGIDLADYTASTLGVTVNLGLGTGLLGDAAGDTLSGIENVTGSNTGADILTGDGNANVLTGLVGADSLSGGLGNDTLDGGADNDTLIGGGGADSLIGGAGIDLADYTASTLGVTVNLGLGTGLLGDAAGDTLSGIENVTGSNTGADILTGDGNANVLTGLVGADSLDGGLGNDTLDGGADNDTLIGGGGADSLIGGAGIDLADYTASTLGVTVNLGLGTGLVGDAAGDTLSGIENVTGSNTGADILTGDGNANVLTGLVGADSLDGGLGNDTLDGGADNDTLIGGGGADSLIGGAGIDLADYTASTLGVTVNLGLGTGLLGDAAGDTLSGIENVTGSNTGADILTGDGNANVLTGLVGADSLSGGLGNDTLDGGADNDTLIGGGGADSLIGGAGIDLADYTASTLGVTVNLGLGTGLLGDAAGDTLSGIENVTGSNTGADILTGDGNANVLTGLVGADSLDGGLGNDTLDGGADNDTLIGGGGADSLIGGAGIDLADYTASTLGVTVNLGLGTGLLGDAAGDTLSGIENVTGSNTGADILTGDGNANVLTGLVGADSLDGGLGNDTLDGGADNDTLIGGGGADSLIGGAGIDLADYTASTLGVTVNLGLGTGLVGDAAGDTLSGIENVTGSNTGADILTGDGNANVLTGLVGADSLDGGLGNDTLDGGADNDTLIGGGGADSLIGGAGIDLADYTASTLGVTVNLGLGTGLLGDAAGDTLSGIENVTGSNTGADILTGDGNANVLTGLVGADSLSGGLGNDTLDGGADNDTLIGGGGADSLIGGAGIDLADYTASTLGVTVNLGLGTGLLGDAAGDTLSGIENVTGSAQADVLTGDGNANVLTGGAGNDTLSGGAGNDTLIGGSGSDVFIGDVGDVVDGSESVLDNDELNLKAYGKAQTTITFSDASHENGSVQFFDSFGAPLGTMTFSNIEKVIPCFTPGSIIRTERGERAVETLRVGDKVLTMDHGLQTIRWIGRRTLAPDELRANPTYCPILLPQGAFGAAGPVRDIMLSPQHRILMTGARAEMLFGEPEVLVAAMHLVGHNGVVQMRPDSITYIHLLFDRHEIIWADGMWTESFQPGDATLGGMDLPQRTEILSLFPELAARSDCFPAARTTLKRYEAKVLLAA